MCKTFCYLLFILLSSYNYTFCDTNKENNVENNVLENDATKKLKLFNDRGNKPRVYISLLFLPGFFFPCVARQANDEDKDKRTPYLLEILAIIFRSSITMKYKIHKYFDIISDLKFLTFYSGFENFSLNIGIEWYYFTSRCQEKKKFLSMSFTIGIGTNLYIETKLCKKIFIILDLTLLKYEKIVNDKFKFYFEFGTIRAILPCKVNTLFKQILMNFFSFSIGIIKISF